MVVGSLILGLIKVLDKPEQVKGSTIKFSQYIKKGTTKFKATKGQRKKLSEVCRDSMLMLVDNHEGENSTIHVATFVESLSFSFEKELKAFYGSEYMNLMLRFCEKQVASSEHARESYSLSDELRDNIRKLIYENFVKEEK